MKLLFFLITFVAFFVPLRCFFRWILLEGQNHHK